MVLLKQPFCKAAFVSSHSSSFLRSKAQSRATSNRQKSTKCHGLTPSRMAEAHGIWERHFNIYFYPKKKLPTQKFCRLSDTVLLKNSLLENVEEFYIPSQGVWPWELIELVGASKFWKLPKLTVGTQHGYQPPFFLTVNFSRMRVTKSWEMGRLTKLMTFWWFF